MRQLAQRRKPEASFKSVAPKPNATEVAARYRQMAEAASKEAESDSWKPVPKPISSTGRRTGGRRGSRNRKKVPTNN